MDSRHFWEDNGETVKYETYNSAENFVRLGEAQLGFSANISRSGCAIHSEDEADYNVGGYLKKGKVSRQDPMSHRIIEKRRRDRMNNCLADLSRLIPPEYLKKGRGRVEKTEIIEMAIKHLKYLQDRIDVVNERQATGGSGQETASEHFKLGYKECVSEAVRYLVDIQGYGSADSLCVQLVSHLQRHCDHITPGDRRENKLRSNGVSSSETASSSSSSHSYQVKPGAMAQSRLRPMEHVAEPQNIQYVETHSEPPLETHNERHFSMACELPSGDGEPLPLPLDGRSKREANLRAVRKLDADDYVHSYKFKNLIERRFSRSQDCDVHADEMNARHAKLYVHKRRRPAVKHALSTSTSASGSTEDNCRDTSPPDTSSESPPETHIDRREQLAPPNHYDTKMEDTSQFVPVFALNSLGKYYVPLSVEYACLSRYLGPYDLLDARAAHVAAPLHPVTIHVNFQPHINYHVKGEPADRDCDWRPA